jgi:hypothetical protein
MAKEKSSNNGKRRGNKPDDYTDLNRSRYGIHLNQSRFDMNVEYGRNYLRRNINHILKLHKINVIESKSHKLYGEARPEDKRFFAPVEFDAYVTIGEQNMDYIDGGNITREDVSELKFDVYFQELEEKGIVIDRGDIVEFNPTGERRRFYEVDNPQNVNDSTSQSFGGFNTYYKSVTAVPVKEDVVPFLNETKD